MSITTKDIAWAAGFLEGEGSFAGDLKKRDSPSIQATQCQKEPLERLQRLFGGTIYPEQTRSPKHKPRSVWFLGSVRAIEVMMTIYVLMSPWRQTRIRSVIAAWKERPLAEKLRTHCPQGHPYNEENTYYSTKSDGRQSRQCKACRKEHVRKSYRHHPKVPFTHCKRGHPATKEHGYPYNNPRGFTQWVCSSCYKERYRHKT